MHSSSCRRGRFGVSVLAAHQERGGPALRQPAPAAGRRPSSTPSTGSPARYRRAADPRRAGPLRVRAVAHLRRRRPHHLRRPTCCRWTSRPTPMPCCSSAGTVPAVHPGSHRGANVRWRHDHASTRRSRHPARTAGHGAAAARCWQLASDRLGHDEPGGSELRRRGSASRSAPRRCTCSTTPTTPSTCWPTTPANYHKGIGLVHARRALGDGLLTSEGELWRKQRKVIQPVFQAKRIAAAGRGDRRGGGAGWSSGCARMTAAGRSTSCRR